jgi:tetratricopeptide (TPR) repeat protein
LVAARPVAAGPRDARSARVAKDAAYKAFELSDYDTAIDEYKKAYSLTRDPRLFYNLGLSHRKRFQLKRDHADLVEARDYFHRFMKLLDPSSRAYSKDRVRLKKMRKLAQTYLEELESELDKPVEPPPAPDPAPPPAPDPAPPPAPDPASSPSGPPVPALEVHERARPPERGPTGTVLLVTASMFGVGAGITGVLALREQRAARDADAIGDVGSSNTHGDNAKRYALVTDVAVGTAIVAGTIGLYLVLRQPAASPSRSSRHAVSISASPFGASLLVRY